ncbi:putative pancreatic secretory proteinase inhibitor [Lissotriton helveticus]
MKAIALALTVLCLLGLSGGMQEKEGIGKDELQDGRPRLPECFESAASFCPLNFSPVCGTDGETYANECLLCAKRITRKLDIRINKNGSC